MSQFSQNLFSKIFLGLVLVSAPAFAQETQPATEKACAGSLTSFAVSSATGEYVGDGQAREYLPDPANPTKEGRIVVMPPTGGENPLDRTQARRFCEKGYLAHVLTAWPAIEFDYNDVRMHDATAVRIFETFSALISTDSRPVGVLGTSLGGIMTSSLVPKISRIEAVVFVVAGVDIPFIVAQSDQKLVVRQREVRMEEHNLKTVDEYEAFMGRAIRNDPIYELAMATDLPPSLHVIAEKDTTVPTSTQEALAQLFPNPEIIKIRASHIPAVILSVLNKHEEILNFMERTLH